MTADALGIMARAPQLNQSKTRLIPLLGGQGALDAHRQLVNDTLTRLSGLSQVAVSLWCTARSTEVERWAQTYQLPLHEQEGDDLGERMHHVLTALLHEGAARACVIGTDCPPIDAGYVLAAFTALERSDVVIGPAEDGGYGLLGLKAPCADLFRGIAWSTSEVCAQTKHRAATLGMRVTELTPIWDVDVPADWQRYLAWREARR